MKFPSTSWLRLNGKCIRALLVVPECALTLHAPTLGVGEFCPILLSNQNKGLSSPIVDKASPYLFLI